jgi:hypothetical protein
MIPALKKSGIYIKHINRLVRWFRICENLVIKSELSQNKCKAKVRVLGAKNEIKLFTTNFHLQR